MDILINSLPTATPSQLSLLDLNDYCLLEIMSWLNVNDLILASMLCKRFQYNAHRLFPHRLQLWKDISDDDVKTAAFLLSKVGRFITEIEVNGDGEPGITIQETMELIQRNCRHLEKIRLYHTVPNDLSMLPLDMKNISVKFPENLTLTDGFLENIKSFNNLESLTLNFKSFTQIDSGFLTELPPLKELRLKNCSVEPIDLQMCLAKSKTELQTLTLRKCFPEFPNILVESVDQLVKLNELECQFNCGPANFSPFSIFNRLTSLKLTNASASIDVDKLFAALIDHNKIQTLSMCSIDNNLPLNRATVKQLHRLTNLRRLHLYETDFVNDEFLTEITKTKSVTHLRYKQTYRPMLSLEAMLTCIKSNGPKLQELSYIVYHDVVNRINQIDQQQRRELLNNFRKTDAFKRVHQCKEDISSKLTSVEFSF